MNLKYKFLLYIFLIVQLFCPFNGLAQDCGCVGCPRVIPVANADFTIDYVVKGLLNDDLAGNQCVASVNIQFRHNRLQNLAIELISPSGQVVPLIGPIFPFGGGLGGTFGASWNVNFVQCFPNALAQPDPGVEEIWYNLDPAWSVFGGSFSGTYYPSEGFCLEEFNDGSANGTWQLRVQNEGFPPSPGAGLIENFTITFCDPTGEGCCAADGGTLPINRITACEGDTSLFVNLQPFFTVDKPDTSIYDYRYLIVRNDSIIAISSSVNLTNYSSAFYVVYGLSFQRSMIDEVDASVGLTISELEALGLCLDLSDNELVIEIIASPPSTDLVQTICQGDSVLVVNIWFSQTGEYFISTLASNGCDSLVHLDLRVLPSLETNLTASICDGESYLFGNRTLTQSGAYVDSLQSISGCDSLVHLDLRVLPSLETNLTASICGGESYLFGNRTLTQSGAYVDSLQSVNGCDSLVHLDLRVLPSLETNLTASICDGESYLFGNRTLTQSGAYVDSLQSISGCDSLVRLDLQVLPSLEANLTASICDGESYLFGNRTLTQSGAYVDSLQSISGCDSLVRLDLQVLPSLEANLTASICTGESYLFGNRTLTQSGAYVDSLQSISGCDSLVRLDLRVISLLADVALALPECNAKDSASIQVLNVRGGTTPYLYSINNQPFNASQRFDNLPSGDYQLVVQDVSGCEWDTLITIPNFSLLEVELGEDIIISPGTPTDIVLTTNQPLTTIRWRASTAEVINCENCTSITVQPNAPTTYFVTAINEQGCTASDDIRVFLEQLSIIYIPNAFSPNGDGENDQFFIQVRPQAVNRVLSFQIFDRWGNIVYELFDFSPDASFTWDGFYKGKIMNPAVFIYNIEIELADGTRKRLVGDFLLTK